MIKLILSFCIVFLDGMAKCFVLSDLGQNIYYKKITKLLLGTRRFRHSIKAMLTASYAYFDEL